MAIPSSITAFPAAAARAAEPILQLVTVFTPPTTCTPEWQQIPGSTSYVLDADDVNCRPFEAPVTEYSPGLCESGFTFASWMWYTRTDRTDAHAMHTVFKGFCCSP